jgi:hypothetical protein
MSTTEIAALRRAIGELRQCVDAVRSCYGDVVAVRRLANDIERLDIDAAEICEAAPVPAARVPAQREIVVVPDTPYDPDLWRGADDEGIGGHHAHER